MNIDKKNVIITKDETNKDLPLFVSPNVISKFFIIVGGVLALVVFVGFTCRQGGAGPAANNQKSAEELERERLEKETAVIWQKAGQMDSDLDGLIDVEEKQLGTNSKSPDTDEDGLLDRDEVKVFKTNPLKADTDGDKTPDGEEVRMRTNPKGAGTL